MHNYQMKIKHYKNDYCMGSSIFIQIVIFTFSQLRYTNDAIFVEESKFKYFFIVFR